MKPLQGDCHGLSHKLLLFFVRVVLAEKLWYQLLLPSTVLCSCAVSALDFTVLLSGASPGSAHAIQLLRVFFSNIWTTLEVKLADPGELLTLQVRVVVSSASTAPSCTAVWR